MNVKIKIIGTPASLPVNSFLSYSYSDEYNSFSGNLPIEVQINQLSEITIGTQVWKTRNLDVTTYSNGDVIPQVSDATQWTSITTGAWCYINNDPSTAVIYGKLYNWYAVNDPRGLAPNGWHVPNEQEWTILSNFLGGSTIAGGKMKEAGLSHWNSPNIGATNSSGFTGLPAPSRNGSTDAYFGIIGSECCFWSSSELDSGYAYYHLLMPENAELTFCNGGFIEKDSGSAVRCIKD